MRERAEGRDDRKANAETPNMEDRNNKWYTFDVVEILWVHDNDADFACKNGVCV